MDYQGNSDKNKKDQPVNPKKDLEKVIKGDIVIKQKPLGVRLKNVFFGGDTITARQYVLGEVILPALRNLVVEAITKGSERLVYGENGVRRRTSSPTYSPRISYNRVTPGWGRESALLPNQPSAGRWVPTGKRTQEDIIVASKADGEQVIEAMTTIVDQYDVVSLADLNELLGLPSSPIENKWGWTNLTSLNLQQVREGWQISFPPLEDIS